MTNPHTATPVHFPPTTAIQPSNPSTGSRLGTILCAASQPQINIPEPPISGFSHPFEKELCIPRARLYAMHLIDFARSHRIALAEQEYVEAKQQAEARVQSRASVPEYNARFWSDFISGEMRAIRKMSYARHKHSNKWLLKSSDGWRAWDIIKGTIDGKPVTSPYLIAYAEGIKQQAERFAKRKDLVDRAFEGYHAECREVGIKPLSRAQWESVRGVSR